MKLRILLVEDNPLTAKGLQYLLEREEYQVFLSSTAADAEGKLEERHYDLVLLDVSLPDHDGFSVAKYLKSQAPNLPIIFLTALDDEEDVVHGLELGADDYITKPFRNRELLLRINNILKRHQKVSTELVAGPIKVNLDTSSAFVHGEVISLTALEYKLLVRLLRSPNQIVTREQLIDEIWDASGSIVNNNTVSVYLKRLREKLGDPTLIETVKSLGYRIRTSDSRERES